jgi:predicted DCC family thiol-disulfide oxidoreductase YuxK
MTDQRMPVLLYDGECGLCNGVVLFMLRHDGGGRMHFAPLQSVPGQAYLRAQGLPMDRFDSLVFVPDWYDQEQGDHRLRTAGALAAFAEMGGAWRALAWLRVVPAMLRDPFYRVVAATRSALFGKYRPRPLPDPEMEKRFLAR